MKKSFVLFLIVVQITSSAGLLPFLNQVTADTSAPVLTPQQPRIAPTQVMVLTSNNIVNAKANYDILFKTGVTGIIKSIQLTFPAGTNIANAIILEASGLPPGTLSVAGQTGTYTITNTISTPPGTAVRLEIGNIINPPNPSNAHSIKVITKDSVGNPIDVLMISNAYSIKQIGNSEVSDNAITSSKIIDGQVSATDMSDNSITTAKILDGQVKSGDLADNSITTSQFASKIADNAVTESKLAIGAVTSDKISFVHKLIFATCIIDYSTIAQQSADHGECSVPGASYSNGDSVVVTNNALGFNMFSTSGVVNKENIVTVMFRNDGSSAVDPSPQSFALIVFHQ
jgi:hypothetical protein